MGKRVNLEDLAAEELTEPAPKVPATPSSNGTASSDSAPAEGAQQLVAISRVALNPLNKRPPGHDEEIGATADTIREDGVLHALTVCSAHAYAAHYPEQASAVAEADWVVLMGNRRLQAARLAGLESVPIVADDDKLGSMYRLMLVENLHHRDLPPVHEAEAMAETLQQDGISQRELARRIGKSHPYVAQRLALLGLISPLRHAFEAGELTVERAREFGELTEEQQRAIVEAGRPYRRVTGNAVTTNAVAKRSIRVSTPAIAAESLRSRFTAAELTELVRLLSDDGLSPPPSEDGGVHTDVPS